MAVKCGLLRTEITVFGNSAEENTEPERGRRMT